MIRQYGDHNWKQLIIPDKPGFIPRRTRYGDDAAWRAGLTPIEYQDKVDVLAWEDLREALDNSHEKKIQPMYHQYNSWAPPGFRYNQNGIGYCWTWSGTACLMDLRTLEAKWEPDKVLLAPVSMGYLVNWQDRGNYLESFIKGARDTGVAPAIYIPGGINSVNRNPANYDPAWETARANYKLDEIWDTDTRNGARTTILHCATILAITGRPIYIAYNWWGHALELVGIRWDESKMNNVVWIIRNSHNEADLIELDGSRGEPDEAYGFVSTVLAA